MKLKRILDWLDRELEAGRFDDVSNNGLQVEGPAEVAKVAFAVDASLESVNAAAHCGAQLAAGAKFCSACGQRTASACSKCGADLAPGAKFCANCGQAADAP